MKRNVHFEMKFMKLILQNFVKAKKKKKKKQPLSVYKNTCVGSKGGQTGQMTR